MPKSQINNLPPTYRCTLSNGIRVVFRQTTSPVAYVGLMVGAGTRDEQPELSGMAHYIEHCVFKGTEHLSARQIISRIEDIGGDINAYTTKEDTTYYAATLSSHVARVTSLLTQMVFSPTFPDKETAKELGVILDEQETYNDSPSELIYDDFEALVFQSHALSMPILGTRKSLKRITRANALSFMHDHYTTDRIVYFCTGQLSWQTVKHTAERYLACIPARLSPSLRTAPEPMTACTCDYRRHTHQIHVMLGGRAYPQGHPKQLSLALLQNIAAGGHLSSMLNLALREQKGLVYTIEGNYTPMSDTGYWSVYYATEKENEQQCAELVSKTLRQLQEQTISSSALARYKRQLMGQMAIAAENQENNALAMAKNILYSNQAPLWQETYQKIEQLTAAQLQDTAQEIFADNNICKLRYL